MDSIENSSLGKQSTGNGYIITVDLIETSPDYLARNRGTNEYVSKEKDFESSGSNKTESEGKVKKIDENCKIISEGCGKSLQKRLLGMALLGWWTRMSP